ncbi:MAG: glycerophosphodiester phosphodiesterase family protein [Nostocoides sp.]
MSESSAATLPAGPLVFAHRGASADEPEHTLAAYEEGIAQGADGVECDVRLTADHHLVCVHDRKVDRTSNGHGVVAALELAQLEQLDWGSWKQRDADRSEGADRHRNQLLTLNTLLTTVTTVDRPLITLIETKHPSRHAGRVEKSVAASLHRFGFTGPGGVGPGGHSARVMSFSHLALQRMRALDKGVGLVYLVEYIPVWLRDGSLPKGVQTLGLDMRLLRKPTKIVDRQHAQGHQIFAWTVDQADDVRRCVDLGVDAIITNRPRFVMVELARNG